MPHLPWQEPETTLVRKTSIQLKVIAAISLLLVICGAYPLYLIWRDHQTGGRPVTTYEVSLARSVRSFFGEYGRYPVADSSGDTLRDSSVGSDLIRILCGKDAEVNPRQMDFLGDMKQAKPDPDTNRPRGGLIYENDLFGVADPFGGPYRILMDTDGNGVLADPRPDRPGRRLLLRTTVLVWSPGEDGDFETWDDNRLSWE